MGHLASRPGDRDGSTLGALRFDSDTGLTFRREILRPFLDRYLKDGRAQGRRGTRHGVRDRDERVAALPAWPSGCASGCSIRKTPLHLVAASS